MGQNKIRLKFTALQVETTFNRECCISSTYKCTIIKTRLYTYHLLLLGYSYCNVPKECQCEQREKLSFHRQILYKRNNFSNWKSIQESPNEYGDHDDDGASLFLFGYIGYYRP